MKNLFLIVTLFFGYYSQAQYNTHQNKVWALGYHAGVSFASGTPVAITTGISSVGSATVANASDSLQFYSDGKNVYNHLHAIMPHGSSVVPYFTGSTFQAALVVPVVGNGNRYYVFSLESYSTILPTTSILAYSIVDMSLDGGNGDVMTTATGITITDSLGESMTAVAGNNCDVWVLVHHRDSALFLAYNISAAGINTTPVLSHTGILNGHAVYAKTAIKVSPDRQKLVLTNNGAVPVDTVGAELYDIDATTGIVSNVRLLDTVSTFAAEFSPDSKKLYTVPIRNPAIRIAEFDISLPNTAAIVASDTFISFTPGGDLKLGPDNKIYVNNQSMLGSISNPNGYGSAVGYVANTVPLITGSMGLPNIVISVASPDTTRVHHDTLCCLPLGTGYTIAAHDTSTASAYMWYDGSTARTKSGITSAGSYWVKIFNKCRLTIDTIHVAIGNCHAGVAGTGATSPATIFPNPATDELIIQTATLDFANLCITNTLGAEIIRAPLTGIHTEMDIHSLAPGMYYITLRGEAGVVTQRFLKQ